MRFGIVAALDSEARVFGEPQGRLLDEHEYRLVVSGPGRANAARATNELIHGGCEVLLSWGLAGGLDPAFAPGQVIVGTRLHSSGTLVFEPDGALVTALCARLDPARFQRAVMMSVEIPVSSRQEKASLYQRFGAATVDMESLAVAQVARSARRPFLSVRAVVDPAGFQVPEAALAGMHDDGTLRPWRTLAALLEAPGEIPAMLRLAAYYRRALAGLRATARSLR
ncbi:MAG: purine phosphorylase [Gammaproteobacteria bacterium]